jgi:hypothetical protein
MGSDNSAGVTSDHSHYLHTTRPPVLTCVSQNAAGVLAVHEDVEHRVGAVDAAHRAVVVASQEAVALAEAVASVEVASAAATVAAGVVAGSVLAVAGAVLVEVAASAGGAAAEDVGIDVCFMNALENVVRSHSRSGIPMPDIFRNLLHAMNPFHLCLHHLYDE